MTGKVECNKEGGDCYASVSKEESITIEASVGLDFDWISGGFAVSKTRSAAEEYGCYGDDDDTVCVWSRIRHTAYTVRSHTEVSCGAPGNSVSEPFVIRSPNKNNEAVDWYCVINNCRGKDDQYWELGRAGGP